MAHYCVECETSFSSIINEQEHERSPAHQKKIDQLLRERDISKSFMEPQQSPERSDGPDTHDPYMTAVDKNQYFCRLCKANCAGRIPAFNHIKGRQHAQKLKQARFSPDTESLGFLSDPNQPPVGLTSTDRDPGISILTEISPDLVQNRVTGHFTCRVCDIRMSGPTPARDHLKGKNHVKKLRIAKEMGYNSSDELSDSFRGLSISGYRQPSAPVSSPGRDPIDEMGRNRQLDTTVEDAPGCLPLVASGATGPTNGQVGGDQTEGERGAGPQRLATITEREPEDIMDKYRADFVIEEGMYKCTVCSVYLNSRQTIGQHFIGKAHLKRKRESTGEIDDQGTQLPVDVERVPETGKFRCTVCNVDMTGTGPLGEHLRGKAHLKKKGVARAYSLPANLSDIIVPPNITFTQRELNAVQESATRTDSGGYPTGMPADSYSQSGETVAGIGTGARSPWNTPHPGEREPNRNESQFAQTPLVSAADPALPSPPTTRPPPGFEGMSLGMTAGATPMADFLNHQKMTSETHPSRMHNFWSMSPGDRKVPDGTPVGPGGVDQSVRIAPIGTPFRNAPTHGSQLQDEQSYDSLKREFTLNHQTMKYMCNTCRIEVTGAENARAHLIGAKHAKKAKAVEFQLYHMPPAVTSAPPMSTQPSSMSPSHQPTPSAPRQPPSVYPASPSGSSIEVIGRGSGGMSSSFEVSCVPDMELPNHYPGATGSIADSYRWGHIRGYDSRATVKENDVAHPLRGASMNSIQQFQQSSFTTPDDIRREVP